MQCFVPSCTLTALWRSSQIAFVFVHHWDSLWCYTTECCCHDPSCLLHDISVLGTWKNVYIVFCSECFVFAKYVFSTAECMHMSPCLISKALVLHLVTQSVWNRHSQGQLCPAGNRARSCFSWIRWRPSITYYLRILFTNLKLVC